MSHELSPTFDTREATRSFGSSAVMLAISSLENPSAIPNEVIVNKDKKKIILGTGVVYLERTSLDDQFIDISEPNAKSEIVELRRAYGLLFVVAKPLSETSGLYPIVRSNPGTEIEHGRLARSYGSALHQINNGNEIITLNKKIKIVAFDQ